MQLVDRSDPSYEKLDKYIVVFKEPSHGATAQDVLRARNDLRLATQAKVLADKVTHASGDGKPPTLALVKGIIADIISRNPIEWIRGCTNVSLNYHPKKQKEIASMISHLPVSGIEPDSPKILSVSLGGDTFVYKIELYENKFLPPDKLVVWLDSPSDPVAVIPVAREEAPAPSFFGYLTDKRRMEDFALTAVLNDLTSNRHLRENDILHRYEPLGNSFPDYEVCIKNEVWGMEVTRVESDLIYYIDIGSQKEMRQIREAAHKVVTQDTVRRTLEKAISEKTYKRLNCTEFNQCCLVLIDIAEVLDEGDSEVWSGIDLSAFDAVVVVAPYGSVAYVKGSLTSGN